MKMQNSNMAKSGGFTLVELVTVIVILAILAAVAYPKFNDLGANARITKLQTLASAMQSAAAMANGQYMATSAGGTPTMTIKGGATSITNINQYPDSSLTGIFAMIDISEYGTPTPGPASAIGVGTIPVDSYPNHSSCILTYTTAVDQYTPPVISVISAASGVANCS